MSNLHSHLSSAHTHCSTTPRNESTPKEGPKTVPVSPLLHALQSAPSLPTTHSPAKFSPAKSCPSPPPPSSPPPRNTMRIVASNTRSVTPCRTLPRLLHNSSRTNSTPRSATPVPSAEPSSTRRPADTARRSRSSRGWRPAGRRRWWKGSRERRGRQEASRECGRGSEGR